MVSESHHMSKDWLDICRAERIDPDEVRLVYSRYDAYRRYAGGDADDADVFNS